MALPVARGTAPPPCTIALGVPPCLPREGTRLDSPWGGGPRRPRHAAQHLSALGSRSGKGSSESASQSGPRSAAGRKVDGQKPSSDATATTQPRRPRHAAQHLSALGSRSGKGSSESAQRVALVAFGRRQRWHGHG